MKKEKSLIKALTVSILALGSMAWSQEPEIVKTSATVEAAPKAENPAPKSEPAGPKAEKASASDPETEWRFLKESANGDLDVTDALLENLQIFRKNHLDTPLAANAQQLMASLYQKKGDYKGAMVTLLRLLYEDPDSKLALAAKSDFLELVDKKLSRKFKQAASELVRAPEGGTAADRLALMLEKLANGLGEALYEPTDGEFRRFQLRFPDYAAMDKLLFNFGRLNERSEKYPEAIFTYRKLLALYSGSALRPRAQFAVAQIYADNLRDYKKAIAAYQELVEKYPESIDMQPALERMAQIFAERLRQYELAIEMDEKISKLFAKSPAALKALNGEAGLQRDKLNQPAEAVKTYRRLAEQFPAPAAVEALQNAAGLARRDLKDYGLEVELRRKIAEAFAGEKDAPGELYSAAQVCEDDIKDDAKAIELYKQIIAKFPQSKQAQKALGRIEKLEKKKQP